MDAGQRTPAADEATLARLLVGDVVVYSVDKADRLVARLSYRNGLSTMRTAIGLARKAERKAQRIAIQEQSERATERAQVSAKRDEHCKWRDSQAKLLADELSQHAMMVALRCDNGLPRQEARECRQELEAQQRALVAHVQRSARALLEHERSCGALQQSALDRDLRLERLINEERLAAAGFMHLQLLQRTKVAARVLLAATSWRARTRISTLRTALRDIWHCMQTAQRAAQAAEEKVKELREEAYAMKAHAAHQISPPPPSRPKQPSGGGAHHSSSSSSSGSTPAGGAARLAGSPSAESTSLREALRKAESAKATALEAQLLAELQTQERDRQLAQLREQHEETSELLQQTRMTLAASEEARQQSEIDMQDLHYQLRDEAENNTALRMRVEQLAEEEDWRPQDPTPQPQQQHAAESIQPKPPRPSSMRARLLDVISTQTSQVRRREVDEQRQEAEQLREKLAAALAELETLRASAAANSGGISNSTVTQQPPPHREAPTREEAELAAAPAALRPQKPAASYTRPSSAPGKQHVRRPTTSSDRKPAAGSMLQENVRPPGPMPSSSADEAASSSSLASLRAEVQSLRKEVLTLSEPAARSKRLERELRDARTFLRQQRMQLQASQRDAIGLSNSLAVALRSSNTATSADGSASGGFELVQVLAEPVVDRPISPVEMLDRAGPSRGSVAGTMAASHSARSNPRTIGALVRWRSKVYALREMTDTRHTVDANEELASRISFFLEFPHAQRSVQHRTAPQQQRHEPHQPHQPHQPQTRPAHARSAPQRPRSAQAAVRGGTANGPAQLQEETGFNQQQIGIDAAARSALAGLANRSR